MSEIPPDDMPQRIESPSIETGNLNVPKEIKTPSATHGLVDLAIKLAAAIPGSSSEEATTLAIQIGAVLSLAKELDSSGQTSDGSRVEEVNEIGRGRVTVTVIYQAEEATAKQELPASAARKESENVIQWATAEQIAGNPDHPVKLHALRISLRETARHHMVTARGKTHNRQYNLVQAMAIAAELPVWDPKENAEPEDDNPTGKPLFRSKKDIAIDAGVSVQSLTDAIKNARERGETVETKGRGPSSVWNTDQITDLVIKIQEKNTRKTIHSKPKMSDVWQ